MTWRTEHANQEAVHLVVPQSGKTSTLKGETSVQCYTVQKYAHNHVNHRTVDPIFYTTHLNTYTCTLIHYTFKKVQV